MATVTRKRIGPQPGPQELFLSKRWVEIIVFGGAAGGGKSYGLLLDGSYNAAIEPVRGFGAVIFRRESPQILATGGLWDTSQLIYPHLDAKPRHTPWLGWEWPAFQTSVRFYHLQREEDKQHWQGAQLDYVGFDELTHFTESQFFYLLSRARSTHNIQPLLRATTNPDPDSWVKRFLAPWVDDEYPDPAESAEVRYFYRDGEDVVWIHKPSERPSFVPRDECHSVTFIASMLDDNPALLASDPGYKGRIQAMPLRDRIILSGGRGAWSIRLDGNMFKRPWFSIVDAAPAEVAQVVRRWDLAGTEPRKGYSDPDYTAGVKMARTKSGELYVLDCILDRLSPAGVKALVRQTAALDGEDCPIRMVQDPGQAGKGQLHDFVTMLQGYDITGEPETGDKITRAKPFSAQCEVGNVKLVKGPWNEAYLNQLCGFPNSRLHDDAVDASSGAFLELNRLRRVPLADEPDVVEKQEQRLIDAIHEAQQDPFAWAERFINDW